MKISLYPVSEPRALIEPAKQMRDWMHPHAHLCTPMTIANSFGWDVITQEDVVASWTGGRTRNDLHISQGQSIAESNFGVGVITLAVGYTWHTPVNTQLMAIPIPNEDHKDFQTLSGIMETDDALKYPWWVNIRLREKGKITIPKGTAIARVFPVHLSDMTAAMIVQEPEPAPYQEARQSHTIARDEQIAKGLKSWTKNYINAAKVKRLRSPSVDVITPTSAMQYCADHKIKIIPSFLTKDECDQVIQLAQTLTPRPQLEVQWDGRTYWPNDSQWPTAIREKITKGLTKVLGDYYGTDFWQTDQHIVRWSEGDKMEPHDDICEGKFPQREYSVLIYLNDDYEGGELHLPDVDGAEVNIVPSMGALVAFNGGTLRHGVKEVTKGVRWSCICWLKALAQKGKEGQPHEL